MKIFDIDNNKVVINPQSLSIPEFKTLWDRDKNKLKPKATKEISYIVFLCDESIDNPYRAYKDIERENVLLKDFMSEGWTPDEKVLAAIEKYKELKQTTNSRLLRSAKRAADKLAEYFDTIDFSLKDSSGKPVYSSRELSSNLKEVAGIVKSLSLLEEMVRKEQTESSSVRGGGDIGLYEIPRDDFDYGLD
jgi:hypothetical protein